MRLKLFVSAENFERAAQTLAKKPDCFNVIVDSKRSKGCVELVLDSQFRELENKTNGLRDKVVELTRRNKALKRKIESLEGAE